MIYYSAFNGIRQWMASVILFWSIRYIIQKDFRKYLICVILISTIHTTALIMVLFYFVAHFRPFGRNTIIMVIIFTIVSMFLPSFLGGFEDTLYGTKYESYISISDADNGVNIFRVLVAAVPVIISMFYYSKIKDDEESHILINASIINLLILFLARQNTIIARFSMYFELYNLLLYPKFLKLLTKDEKNIYVYFLVVSFFVYMCLLLPTESNLLPYKFFFNK